ncbi:MAG: site-specific DNA-methyltransferase [Fibromonadales bacterium]|nr:site-specific DNA-methyltransferase [Fibromonadales bacterium]
MFENSYLYATDKGRAIVGDSLELMKKIPDDSVNLVITSPPFALQRQKEYGNKDQTEYINWILDFTQEVQRIIKEDGSFVIDLGGAYQRGIPIRSLYNFRLLLSMCDEQGWKLAEEFFWFNPAKLPSPIEWVNKRKIRAKDSVNTVWWLSKSDFPKADVRNVLTEYSGRMKKLLEDSSKFYTPKKRPSGHDISYSFAKDNGGAIPSNLLQIPNTDSNSQYLSYCKLLSISAHPARFPSALPEFFIKMLTDENDLVLDIFAGSNTTGWTAQTLNRNWLSFELEQQYLAASAFRFLANLPQDEAISIHQSLLNNSGAKINLVNDSFFPLSSRHFETKSNSSNANIVVMPQISLFDSI